MKTTINEKEIRERVKELLKQSKVISVKVRVSILDFITHHTVYVTTTNSIEYKMTKYYYQNGELLTVTGEVWIYDIERMEKLFNN